MINIFILVKIIINFENKNKKTLIELLIHSLCNMIYC